MYVLHSIVFSSISNFHSRWCDIARKCDLHYYQIEYDELIVLWVVLLLLLLLSYKTQSVRVRCTCRCGSVQKKNNAKQTLHVIVWCIWCCWAKLINKNKRHIVSDTVSCGPLVNFNCANTLNHLFSTLTCNVYNCQCSSDSLWLLSMCNTRTKKKQQ